MNVETALASATRRRRAVADFVARRAAAQRPQPSRCSRPGSAPANASRATFTRPASRTTRPRPRRCAASCISSATARRTAALMETPPSPAGGFRPRRRRRAARRRRRARRRAGPGSTRSRSTRSARAYGIPATPGRLRRDARGGRSEGRAVARGRPGGRGQDPLPRHRPQVRRRRRAARPDRRGGRARRLRPRSSPARRPRGRTRTSPASRSSR